MEQNENEFEDVGAQFIAPDSLHPIPQNDIHAPDSLRPTLLARLGLHSSLSAPVPPVDVLIEAMKSPRWQERTTAIQALGTLENDTALEALLAALHDEDMNVRAAALRAIGHMGKTLPNEPLMAALSDPDWLVREAAVLTLGEIGQEVPTDYLQRAQHDENEFVREAASLFPLKAEESISSAITIAANEAAFSRSMPQNALKRVKTWFVYGDTRQEDMNLDDENEITIMPLDDANSDSRSRNQRRGAQNPRLHRRARRMLEGAAAILIVVAIMLSWFVVTARLHPSTVGQLTQAITSQSAALQAPVLFRYTYQSQYRQGNVYPAQWTSEGGNTYLVFGHDNGTSNNGLIAYAWNAATKQLRHMLIKPTGNVPDYSQDVFWTWQQAGNATYIVYMSQNGQLQLWNAVTGKAVLSYNSHTSTFPVWSFCNDGRLIALNNGVDGNFTIQSMSTGQVIAVDHESLQKIGYVQWSADDHYLAAVSTAQGLRVWNVSTGKVSLAIASTPTRTIDTISWAPESPRITVAYQNAPMQTWNTITGKLMLSYNVVAPYMLVWSNDGIHIITAINSANNLTQVWDSYTGVMIAKLSIPGVTWHSTLLSNNGKYLAFNTGDSPTGNNVISILDMQTGRTLLTYTGHPANAQLVAIDWSPDDQLIASATNDGQGVIWNTSTGKTISNFDTQYQNGPVLNWSPNGKMLVYTTDTTVQVLQIR
jgi:WD40 repeat protein